MSSGSYEPGQCYTGDSSGSSQRVNALSYTFVVEVIVPVEGNVAPYTGSDVLDRIDAIFVDDDAVDVDVRLVDAESI